MKIIDDIRLLNFGFGASACYISTCYSPLVVPGRLNIASLMCLKRHLWLISPTYPPGQYFECLVFSKKLLIPYAVIPETSVGHRP